MSLFRLSDVDESPRQREVGVVGRVVHTQIEPPSMPAVTDADSTRATAEAASDADTTEDHMADD